MKLDSGAFPAGPMYPFIPLDLAISSCAETQWVVEGFLARGAVVVLAGEPKKSRKTILTVHLALCVATGNPFLGFPVNQGSVFMLNVEDGLNLMALRFKHHGVEINPELRLPINLLQDPNSYQIAIDVIRRERPSLVVMDSLAKLWPIWGVKNENDAIDVTRAITPICELSRETQSNIVLVHHTNAKERDVRGSTALKAAPDGWLLLDPPSVKKPELGRRLSWWLKHAPDGEVSLDIRYADGSITVVPIKPAVIGDDQYKVKAKTSTSGIDDEAGYNRAYNAICADLQNNRFPRSFDEIISAVKARKDWGRRALNSLKDRGWIVHPEGSRKWVWCDNPPSPPPPPPPEATAPIADGDE